MTPRATPHGDRRPRVHLDSIHSAPSGLSGRGGHPSLRSFGLVLTSAAIVIAPLASGAEPNVAKGRFTHRAHEAAGLKLECSACHGAPATGQLTMPGKDHKPCSNEGCHAGEYRKKNSQLCFSCHVGNEPWKANPTKSSFKLPPEVRSEFYVGFSHKSHLARGLGAKEAGAACASCHVEQAGSKAPDPPDGHLAPSHILCASCHEAVALPRMPECAGCHTFDTAARPGAAQAGAGSDEWRVRTFSHESHRVDIRTAKEIAKDKFGWARFEKVSASQLACDQCHAAVAQAGVGVRPERPKMAGCATCHNGTFSFKATGHACMFCHAKPG